MTEAKRCGECGGMGRSQQREIDRLREVVIERLEAERDEARHASEITHGHYVLAGKERDEARALNAKYLAVIHAKDAEIVAINECWKKSLQVAAAMMEAGLRFKHVSFDTQIKTEGGNA